MFVEIHLLLVTSKHGMVFCLFLKGQEASSRTWTNTLWTLQNNLLLRTALRPRMWQDSGEQPLECSWKAQSSLGNGAKIVLAPSLAAFGSALGALRASRPWGDGAWIAFALFPDHPEGRCPETESPATHSHAEGLSPHPTHISFGSCPSRPGHVGCRWLTTTTATPGAS